MNPPTITPEQANTFINVTLPIYISIALAIGGAILSVYTKLKGLSATVDKQGERIDAHGDRIHELAMNAQPPTMTVQPAPAPDNRPPMASLGLIAFAAILSLAGCASDGTLTPQGKQGVSIGVAILNAAIDGYVQVDAAKTSGKPLSKAAIVQLAKNDVSGVLAQMQANVGKTPDTANKGDGVFIGAANPIVGLAIQDALPSATITQSTINQIASVTK